MSNNFDIAKEILNQNGEITGLASGNSMKPLFRSRKDKAVIVPITRELKPNDVILYRKLSTNEVILHRIIKITNNGFIIRGDNLYNNETNIAKDDILGVLKGFYRNGKYYECEESFGYKLYVFYIRISYPIRYCFSKGLSLLKGIVRKFINIFA